ncbi:MAG: UDP-N-acetylmuramate dehydrogenase [Candidatus Liptonbacteria bacterium]|nr:UDP-N-acetylmuramate dehydrogenase [Candidatus Liptonbacteria bacterium]
MRFQENVPLSQFSSYKIGGRARYFCAPTNEEELRSAIGACEDKLLILGGGTNLLINDRGFDGLVLKPALCTLEGNGTTLRVGAGVNMDDLLNHTIAHGLTGVEWAGGLPGTVGGAIRGNAGAFGGEIKDVVVSVESFDTDAVQVVSRMNTECRFSYRSSIFKERPGKEIILAATIKLSHGEPERIQAAINEKIDYRRVRHPMEYPNIGSIFKNVLVSSFPASELHRVLSVMKSDPVPVIPTAHLIAEAGLKGVSLGGAMISPKHPNFIVNVFDARASDVRALISLIQTRVKEEFFVDLEHEVEFVD